jgi:hypothetical protein
VACQALSSNPRESRGEPFAGNKADLGQRYLALSLGSWEWCWRSFLVAVGPTFVFHHKKAINNLENCLNNATSRAQKNSCNQQFRTPDHVPEPAIDVTQLRSYDDLQHLLDRFGLTG